MLKIYNTLTRQKEEFIPREGNKVNMFVCGPTVYDYSHIGHARTYVFFDVLAKYLRYKEYEVFYLQNITDIDDKIINRANQSKKDPLELSRELTDAHYDDMRILNINSITKYAPATEYIPQIINQVVRLLKKDFAYKIEGDGYYFDLSKDLEYGKLSGRTTEAAEDALSRIDESVNKRNKGDFCLWKFSKQGEPSWPSELGDGRPGWHIEDTAITEANFGPQYDLHGGALELMFPHHEAEIAQMESISGKIPLVKYWVHTGVLTIGNKKMGKSLGNFITIRDIVKEHSTEALRFMMLSGHYRMPIDYSEESIKAAEAAVQRLNELSWKLENIPYSEEIESSGASDLTEKFKENIENAMSDDLNTPQAIAYIFELVKQVNILIDSKNIGKKQALKVKDCIAVFAKDIFGIMPKEELQTYGIESAIETLISQREKAREQKDYKKADELREQIKTLGYTIDDTPYGPLIRKK